MTLSLLNLIRLLPPATAGPVKHNRLTDEKSARRLIIFKKSGSTNTDLVADYENNAPYVVALGSSKNKIDQYFVVLDRNLIPLSPETTILDAVDIVYQLHFIFNIQYDLNLCLFWKFIQYYIYCMQNIRVPTTVKETFLKLNRLRQSGTIRKLYTI